MSIKIQKPSQEKVAAFFKKKGGAINRLLKNSTPKATEEPAEEEIVTLVETAPVEEEQTADDDIETALAEEDIIIVNDDLTIITGLGQKMAEKLAEVGINTFAQLAAMSEEEANELDNDIRGFSAKFTKKEWAKQAQELLQ